MKISEVADTTENLKRNVSAGDDTFQLYSIYDQNFGVLVPYMQDFNMVPALRLEQKHWNPNATQMYNFSNKQLALAGNISLSVISGAGLGFTGIDSEGYRSLNLHLNEPALNLTARLMDALYMPGYNYNESAEVWDQKPDLFTPGNALFTLTSGHGVDKLRAMEDDIGILPYPKYSENQQQYFATTYGNALWVLPKTVDLGAEGDFIGTIMEAMSFSGYYDIIPQYKEIVLKTKSARRRIGRYARYYF
jgi:hypothetical protein